MPMLQTTNASLHHERAGAHGPAVLMVQGVGAIGEGWRAMIERLFRHKGGDMTAPGEIPTLLITGALDRVVLTTYSDDLLLHLPQARLVRFADAGHAIILQCPDEVAQLLREHIAKTE